MSHRSGAGEIFVEDNVITKIRLLAFDIQVFFFFNSLSCFESHAPLSPNFSSWLGDRTLLFIFTAFHENTQSTDMLFNF